MPSNIDPYTGKPLPPSAMYPQGAPPSNPLAPPQAPQAGTMSAAEQAQIAALLGTFGEQSELDTLEKQMAQAEALRMATPEGRSSGRVYTAANPLEHLGKGIGDYKLMKKRQATDKRTGELNTSIGGKVSDYGKLVTKDL